MNHSFAGQSVYISINSYKTLEKLSVRVSFLSWI